MKVSIAYKDDKYFNPVDYGYYTLACDFVYKSCDCSIEFYNSSNEFLGAMSVTPFVEVIISGDDLYFYCLNLGQAVNLYTDIELNTGEPLISIELIEL